MFVITTLFCVFALPMKSDMQSLKVQEPEGSADFQTLLVLGPLQKLLLQFKFRDSVQL